MRFFQDIFGEDCSCKNRASGRANVESWTFVMVQVEGKPQKTWNEAIKRDLKEWKASKRSYYQLAKDKVGWK